jgi:hypothetical protein
MLTNLYHIYSNLDPVDDSDVCDEILDSLEKRWAAADQEPFIAAVILNPYLHGDFLGRGDIALTLIGLCNMLKHLQWCMFKVEADADFQAAFMDYYNKHEEFAPEAMALVDWMNMAWKKVSYTILQTYGQSTNRSGIIKKEQEVNPVEIWEGIDTGEETGHNCLTKIAIHILSVIANSAGCKHAFSHMGLVHTAIRSKLGIEKVQKATVIGMDIKRMHMEAGLLHVQGQRNFTSKANKQDIVSDIGDINSDPLDFDQLSNHIIAGAASANSDKDVGDVGDDKLPLTVTVPDVLAPQPPPQVRLTITIPPLPSASHSAQPTPVKVSTLLRSLFKYPTNDDPPSDGMSSFWRGGVQNLEKELEAYELLSQSGKEISMDVEIGHKIPVVDM